MLVAVLLSAAPAALAKKKDKQPQPFAVIAGTVFRTPGFALPAAELLLVPGPEASSGGKTKKLQAVSSARGEWAIRVPAVPMKYTLHVKANGYQSQQKTVTIQGEQREEVNFVLEPFNPAPAKEEKR